MCKQIRKAISIIILAAFISTSIKSPAFAQAADQMPYMPKPGVRLDLSPDFTPAVLKGISIHLENPLMFDFIIYRGDKVLSIEQKQEEYKKLVKYFLASLAIPDEDQWVNLSPYEKDRIIKDDFGKTLMGRDLLAQDYILKQITASLIYPEDSLGKKFWDKVYTEAQQQYGTTNIPVNTFNKVWILPDDALIYEKGNTAYVLKNHLKVMLEEDYLALSHQRSSQLAGGSWQEKPKPAAFDLRPASSLGSQIIKQIILPALEKEVNEGQNFAMLRQVYSGMLLAAWFKRTLKQSILARIYADKTKVKGVEWRNGVIATPSVGVIASEAKQSQQNLSPDQIYRQYLKAYKKGVFNYIKEDADKYTNETIPRKYFSGGTRAYVDFAQTVHFVSRQIGDSAMAEDKDSDDAAQVVLAKATSPNAAMTAEVKKEMARVALLQAARDTARAGLKEVHAPPIYYDHLNEAKDIQEILEVINFLANHAPSLEVHLFLLEIEDSIDSGIPGFNWKTPSSNLDNLRVEKSARYLLVNPFTDLQVAHPWGMYIEAFKKLDVNKIKLAYLRPVALQKLILEKMRVAGWPSAIIDRIKNWFLRVFGKDNAMVSPSIKLRIALGIALMFLDIAENQAKNYQPAPAIAGVSVQRTTALSVLNPGGIDMNSANLNLQIKRDGRGVPLPWPKQDIALLSNIEGLEPVILSIKPAGQTPLFSQL